MCVAIAQPKGVNTLSEDYIRRGWKSNPDGGGLAYINEDNQIVVYKSMDLEPFIETYMEAHKIYGETSPFLVHMRIATHGSVNIDNCHPFVNELDGDGEMVYIHNGIIDEFDSLIADMDITDTVALSMFVLQDFKDDWLDNQFIVNYIEDLIDWSKLAFLTTSPALKHELYILNDKMGTWDKGSWFSNYSCFVSKSVPKVRQYDYDSWDGWTPAVVTESSTFDQWLRRGKVETRYTADELRNATDRQHVDMAIECDKHGDHCNICTGKNDCYCDDMCFDCYEFYTECECMGKFISLLEACDEGYCPRAYAIDETVADEVPDECVF